MQGPRGGHGKFCTVPELSSGAFFSNPLKPLSNNSQHAVTVLYVNEHIFWTQRVRWVKYKRSCLL